MTPNQRCNIPDVSPLPAPYYVTKEQKARFMAAGVPEHQLIVAGHIPTEGTALYVQTVGRVTRQVFGGRRGGKTEAQRVWLLTRGPEYPIEPLGAGLSRILSRGAPQPVRYPRGG